MVIQQNNRKLLMMDTLMSETCWAHKKWNKIASDIRLVFYSSTNKSMHLYLLYILQSTQLYSKSIGYSDVLRLKNVMVRLSWEPCSSLQCGCAHVGSQMAHNVCCDSYHVYNVTYLSYYCTYIRGSSMWRVLACYFLGIYRIYRINTKRDDFVQIHLYSIIFYI